MTSKEVEFFMNNFDSDKKRLLEVLREDAFFKEKITLSSGKTSDFYIDARRVTLSAEGAYLCARVILEILKNENVDVDAIGGPTLGADPLLGAIGVLSFQAKKPINTFIIRKAPKPYGKQQQIEGPLLDPKMNIILIDDVATTGKSFMESIEVLSKMGIKIKKSICIVDRNEGGREALAKLGCELVSLFTLKDFPV